MTVSELVYSSDEFFPEGSESFANLVVMFRDGGVEGALQLAASATSQNVGSFSVRAPLDGCAAIATFEFSREFVHRLALRIAQALSVEEAIENAKAA